jgi:hypothetical protein
MIIYFKLYAIKNIMYKVCYVKNDIDSDNIDNLIKTKMITINGTIYQVLRDIEFMVEIDKDEIKNTPKNFKLKLVKEISDENKTCQNVGDFYFEISYDMLTIGEPKYLFDERTYGNKFIMTIKISNYKDENTGDVNFYITHPSVEIIKS